MVYSGGMTDTLEEAKELIIEKLNNNEAYNKQMELIKYQGGYIKDLDTFVNVREIIEVKSTKSGYIKEIDALAIGLGAMKLGAGRETKDDPIDPDVGIILKKKVGYEVKVGETLALLYNNKDNIENVLEEVLNAFVITEEKVEKKSIILEIITE